MISKFTKHALACSTRTTILRLVYYITLALKNMEILTIFGSYFRLAGNHAPHGMAATVKKEVDDSPYMVYASALNHHFRY